MVKKANTNSKSKTVKFNNNDEKQDIKQDIKEELKEETKLVGGLKNVDDADDVEDDDYSTDQGEEEEVEKEETVYHRNLVPKHHSPSFLSDALCYNACEIAKDVEAHALIGMTQSGYTGFMLSSYRPHAPLYVFTKTQTLVNQLSLSWGVKAFYYDREESMDRIIADQIEFLKEKGLLKTGDVVVNTGSTPVEEHLPTNMLKITKVN